MVRAHFTVARPQSPGCKTRCASMRNFPRTRLPSLSQSKACPPDFCFSLLSDSSLSALPNKPAKGGRMEEKPGGGRKMGLLISNFECQKAISCLLM